MKNISKKVFILLMIFSIILSIPLISRAENESVETNPIDYLAEDIVDEENSSTEAVEINSTETNQIRGTVFSADTDDIIVSTDVYGDIFLFSSGTVKIENVTISGNAFIFAPNIEISEHAEIYSSLFTLSNDLTIYGSIDGSIYALAETISLKSSSFVDGDIFLTCENINLDGNIYGDANISANQITIANSAYIANDFNYTCEKEIDIPKEVIFGNVNYSSPNVVEEAKISEQIVDWCFSAIGYIVLVIVLFAISKIMNCKFMANYTNFVALLPKYLLYGLLGLIVTPIISISLLFFGITAPLAIILLAIYLAFILIASASVIITLAMLFANKFKEKITLKDNTRTILLIVILCIIYKLLRIIPWIGAILSLVMVIVGFGILIRNLFPQKEKHE